MLSPSKNVTWKASRCEEDSLDCVAEEDSLDCTAEEDSLDCTAEEVDSFPPEEVEAELSLFGARPPQASKLNEDNAKVKDSFLFITDSYAQFIPFRPENTNSFLGKSGRTVENLPFGD